MIKQYTNTLKTSSQNIIEKILLLSLIFCTVLIHAQENCTNGIDDDGDGFIDLQDEDCICGSVFYSEVNGDFEEYSCCPTTFTIFTDDGIYCLDDGWAPASPGTSDYFNTCGYIGGDGALPTVPMPIPSGQGAVGILLENDFGGLYYETIGVCLDNAMIAGEEYNLSFYIGFNSTGSLNSDLDITLNLFGTEDCNNFPQNMDASANCLSTYDEWELISEIPVLGLENDSWLYVSTTFIANINAEAIAFGHDCNQTNAPQYHFIDNININGNFFISSPEEDLISSGNCLDGISVELPNSTGPDFQWFLDGVAISGATTNPYLITDSSAEGEYQVMVTNGGDCEISNPIDIVFDADAIEIEGEITEIQCILNNDGMIDISANSPNIPFDFAWSNGSTSEDILGEGPGSYTVTVTDDNGCFGVATFDIPEPLNVDATLSGDCVNGVFISIDDIPGASYQWYLDGVLIPDADSNPYQVPSDLNGMVHVVATVGNNCTLSNPLQIEFDFEVLGIEGEVMDLLCFGLPSGSINVIADDVNQPLIYEWENGEETQQITNLEAGTYIVTVTDANGCFGIMVFSVDTPSPFINSLTVVQPDMGNPGAASISSSGGTTPYSYAWNNGFDQSTDNNLAAGSYSVTVTDGNGCAEVFEFEIISNYIVIEMVTDESCMDVCDGSILLTIDGGNSNYSVVWDDSNVVGFNPNQLCSGTYAYTVTDSDNSPYVGIITINSPPEIFISATYQDTICANETGSDISLLASGGTPPFTYLWNTGSTNDTLFAVGPGAYSVEVTDSLGCSILDTFLIDSLPLIQLQFELTSTGCNGEENGAIDLTVNNGFEPFSILWSNDSISVDLIDLAAGWYFVTVTDSYGCMVVDSALVNANSGIEVIETVNPVNCNDEDNGSISLDISGGQIPYDILWSNDEKTATIENLASGFYEVTIVDDIGCTWSQNYEVLLNSNIDITSEISDNECFDEEEGSIELTINNANSSYMIMWDDGSTVEDRYNLSAGEYNVALIDSFGCEYLDSFLIIQGEEITYQSIISEPGCNGAEDGTISISPVTGALPFSFEWSNGETINQITDLSSDTYFLTITDINNCIKMDTFILSENSDVEVSETIVNNRCYGENGGSIDLDINGGIEPYSILWSNNETSSLIENLLTGDYSVTIQDAIGCSSSYVYIVSSPDSLYMEDFIVLPLCYNDLGNINVQGIGGTPLYSYLWSTSETTQNINISPDNIYSVTLTDMNECTVSKTYDIEEITEIEITIISAIDPSASNDDGMITIDVSGGTPDYTITWDNGQSGLTANNLGFGAYTATVVDANGCTQTISINLSNDPLSVSGTATDNLCFGECKGQITLTIEGGSQPYLINWSDGQSESNAISLCNGSYQATVTDGIGEVIITDFFIISSPNEIIIDGKAYDISCIEANDGAIAIDSEGGQNPIDYNWSNAMGGDSISHLSPGIYGVTVMDNNGCSESEIFTIDDILLNDIVVETLELDCDNLNNTIVLNGENDNGYQYFLNGVPILPNAQNEINGLQSGVYHLTYAINETCIIDVETIIIEEQLFNGFEFSDLEFSTIEGDEIFISLNYNQDSLLSVYTIVWETLNPSNCLIINEYGQCTKMSITAQESEIVNVVITDIDGCEKILEARIDVKSKQSEIYIPNIFSPNDDGINDDFTIISNDDDVFVKSMQIFDRWGNIVYIQQNIELQNLASWNGEINGKKAMPNVFVYRIELTDGNGEIKVLFGDLAVVY